MEYHKRNIPGIQHSYYIYLKEGQNISDKVFERMEIYDVYRYRQCNPGLSYPGRSGKNQGIQKCTADHCQ